MNVGLDCAHRTVHDQLHAYSGSEVVHDVRLVHELCDRGDVAADSIV